MNSSEKLRKLTKDFLLNEGQLPPIDTAGHLQSIEEALNRLTPNSLRGKRDVAIAKSSIREVRRSLRRQTDRINTLEEQIRILEESSS